MEGNSGDSGSDYFDCATDRSRSSSEEVEDQAGPSIGTKEKGTATDEVQRVPTIRRFRRIDNNRRKAENAETEKASVSGADSESNSSQGKQTGDGVEICAYELRAPQSNSHALKRLSMDATLQRQEFLEMQRKAEVKSQSMRSKVCRSFDLSVSHSVHRTGMSFL